MAEIKEVDFGVLGDIPKLMENMANEIRNGEHGKIRVGFAVFLDEDEVPIVCGWGADADSVTGIGVLQLGVSWLALRKVAR